MVKFPAGARLSWTRRVPLLLPARPLLPGSLRLGLRSWLLPVALPLLLGGCSAALMDPRGQVGREEKTLLIDSLAIMLAIVVPTIIATLAFAWWYRASNTRATYRPDWSYSGRIELVVWAIPLMVIMLLGGVTWIGAHRLDPARPLESDVEPLDVEVVSLDWKWLFIYPSLGVASVNRLVVPAGVPLRFSLTSASVMNTFFVPQLGSMIYTMNGMTTRLNLIADSPGIFRGLSGHFSGDGFSDMHFQVQALPAAGFNGWVQAARNVPALLDARAYLKLTIQGPASVHGFGRIEDGLFARITAQDLAPGRGPETERNGAGEAPAATSTSGLGLELPDPGNASMATSPTPWALGRGASKANLTNKGLVCSAS